MPSGSLEVNIIQTTASLYKTNSRDLQSSSRDCGVLSVLAGYRVVRTNMPLRWCSVCDGHFEEVYSHFAKCPVILRNNHSSDKFAKGPFFFLIHFAKRTTVMAILQASVVSLAIMQFVQIVVGQYEENTSNR